MSESSNVLKLRGLPFEARESDVTTFFAGFQLQHVHLCRHNGRTTGEAYVQLMTNEEAQQAQMRLNRSCMGRRYIEIFLAKSEEMKKRRALESQVTGFILRMRGLPFNITSQDVQKFFQGIPIATNRDSIYMTYDANRRPTGEAFVEFPTEQAREEALKRDRKMMGHRYVELFPASKSDVDRAVSQNRYYMQQGQSFLQGFLENTLVQQQLTNLCAYNSGVGCKGVDIAEVLQGMSLDAQSCSSIQYQDNVVSNAPSSQRASLSALENHGVQSTMLKWSQPQISEAEAAALGIKEFPASQAVEGIRCYPADFTNDLSQAEIDLLLSQNLQGIECLNIDESLLDLPSDLMLGAQDLQALQLEHQQQQLQQQQQQQRIHEKIIVAQNLSRQEVQRQHQQQQKQASVHRVAYNPPNQVTPTNALQLNLLHRNLPEHRTSSLSLGTPSPSLHSSTPTHPSLHITPTPTPALRPAAVSYPTHSKEFASNHHHHILQRYGSGCIRPGSYTINSNNPQNNNNGNVNINRSHLRNNSSNNLHLLQGSTGTVHFGQLF